MIKQLYTLPAVYLANVYGAGSYNTSQYSATGSSTTTSTGGGSSLVNTGVFVAGFITLAAVVLLVALVVRIWRRPAKHDAKQPHETE